MVSSFQSPRYSWVVPRPCRWPVHVERLTKWPVIALATGRISFVRRMNILLGDQLYHRCHNHLETDISVFWIGHSGAECHHMYRSVATAFPSTAVAPPVTPLLTIVSQKKIRGFCSLKHYLNIYTFYTACYLFLSASLSASLLASLLTTIVTNP